MRSLTDVERKKIDHIRLFAANRPLAHEALFARRHLNATPDFHPEIIKFLHSRDVRGVILAFRGAAKSSLAEEDIVLDACLAPFSDLIGYECFHNCVIVGASEKRAIERLQSIKVELETNEMLIEHFGFQKGSIWQETKIVLANGRVIQAIGRDQAVRGLKHGNWRPDRILIDDVEERENVQTPEGRRKTMLWLVAELLPAADVHYRIRVLATPMDKESVPQRLIDEAEWPKLVIPVETIDQETGERKPTWPSRFPLHVIDDKKRDYYLTGTMHIWESEMLCQARSEADRVFRKEYFRVATRDRSYHAVYAMIDPARSVNRMSATTGWAVWSWIGNPIRLHVWASGAQQMLPDEMVELAFTICKNWNPVRIWIEEDGLSEFINQPMRHEQAKRHMLIPYAPLRAPKNKLGFIGGLQPFYANGEVTHQGPLPELEAQLMSFPGGNIDAPNALAYAQLTRPVPVYDNWSSANVAEEHLEPDSRRPLYLAANATLSMTTAVLCQYFDDRLYVYRDWVVEGSPMETVPGIHSEASLSGDAVWREEAPVTDDWREALKLPVSQMVLRRDPPKWIVGPHHGNEWNNVGLEQAIRRLPNSVARGTAETVGRDRLRAGLERMAHGNPAVLVDPGATWVLRAFAGGYSRQVRKGGGLSDEAEPGVYRLLMEGLESFVGMTHADQRDEPRPTAQPYAINRFGERYKSALPQRRLH